MSIVQPESAFDADASVTHYLADQVTSVEAPINRVAVAFVLGCAAVLLWSAWPEVCSGLSLCALAGIPLEQKRRMPLPDWAAKIWPDEHPCAEHNRQQWVKGVKLARGGKHGWVVDIRAKEQLQ